MGIMQNKVTRRVALGSIAGGLAATAAVVRALKGAGEVQMPEGKRSRPRRENREFATKWEEHVKTLDVSIKKIDGPAQFTLAYKPKEGTRFQVSSLTASYDEHSSPAAYPKLPFWWAVTKGQVTAIPPVEDAMPSLSIVAEMRNVQSSLHRETLPGGKIIVIPMSGELRYFQTDAKETVRVSAAKVNPLCVDLAKGLTFDFPAGKPLVKGTKWTIPEKSRFSLELPCEIVGFAEVSGRKTAEIRAKRHLSNQEFLHYVSVQMQEEGKIEQERGSNIDVTKATKGRLDAATKEKTEMSLDITCYIDLDSGLVMRKETTMTTHKPQSPKLDRTDVFIFQAIQG